jgi:hypothetical protein
MSIENKPGSCSDDVAKDLAVLGGIIQHVQV